MSRIDGAAIGDPDVPHPSTVIDDAHRYGCHNRGDFAPFYTVRVRDFEPGKGPDSGRPYRTRLAVVENRFTRPCAHATVGQADVDPACRDCRRLRENLS